MKRSCINWRGPLTLIFAGILAGFSSSALAAGPAFTGLAANADTAETVYLNPAGMTRLKQPSWYGNPMLMYTESKTEFTAEGQQGKKEIDDDSVLFLPGIYYARPINDKWFVGIGPNAATGLGSSYDDEWPGRYMLDEWSLVFVGVVPSVAYKVNSKLSIGASLSLNYSLYNLEKAVFNGPGEADGDFELEADGYAIGANIGLLYELNQDTRLGLVYRSELEANDEGDPDFSDLTSARQNLLDQAGILNQDISLDTNQPQSVLAGIYHDFNNDWTVSVDCLWLDFSNFSIENVEIGTISIEKEDTDYKDIWAGSVGVTYALLPNWTLRGGFLYMSSALDDEDRTIFSRYDSMWALGFGVEHTFNEKRRVAVDITYFQFGDGEFRVDNAPIVGDIEGEYDTNYGVALGISTTF